MATRYWVGGTGTWNATATTNWSATSGGAGGASAPTSADDVIFDANSGTGTTTCSSALCGTLNTSATTGGTISGTLTCYGSVTIGATLTSSLSLIITPVGSATLTALSASKAISSLTVSSGTVTLNATTLNIMGTLTLNGTGTFNTGNNNFTVTTFTCSSGTPTLNLGSSTITVASSWTVSNANLTLNAGTSTISLVGTSFAGSPSAAQVYNNVTFTTAAGTGNMTVSTCRCVNLTFAPVTTAGTSFVTLGSTTTTVATTIVVSGTFTSNNANANMRRFFIGGSTGYVQQTTLSVGTSVISNCDFYKIVATGTASWTGTNLGDGGFTSGITFATPKTVYWATTSANWNAALWATSSGGTGSTANYPLPQDTVIVDNMLPGSGNTITIGNVLLPTIDFSARTLPVTVTSGSSNPWQKGDRIYSSAVTVTATTQLHYFIGNTTLNYPAGITTFANAVQVTNGASLTTTTPLTFTGGTFDVYGTLNLGANLTYNYAAYVKVFDNATLNLNGYTLTAQRFSSGTENVTVNFGTTGKLIATIPTGGQAFIFRPTSMTGSKDIYVTTSATAATTITTVTNGNAELAFNLYVTNSTLTGTLTATGTFNVCDLSGYTATGALSISSAYMHGQLTLPTNKSATGGGTAYFNAGSSLTTNGATLNTSIQVQALGGTFTLNDNLNCPTGTLTFTEGTLNANDKNVTIATFNANSTPVGPRVLNFGSGLWTITETGVAWNGGSTNMTHIPGTSEVRFTGTAATVTLNGQSMNFNKVTIAGGSATNQFTIMSAFTAAEFSSTRTSTSYTIQIASGQTINVGNWTINGSAGNIVTLAPSSTTNYTINYTGTGIETMSYVSASRFTGTPGMTWLALNSTNGGNNSGLYFDAFPSGNGLFFGSNF